MSWHTKWNSTNYKNLVRYLEHIEVPKEFTIKELRRLKAQAQYFLVREGILYRKNNQDPDSPLRVLKKEQTEIIIRAMHENLVSGHLNKKAMIDKIRKRYFWNQMISDVKNFIKSCDACQRRGKPKTKEPLYPIKVTQPFD